MTLGGRAHAHTSGVCRSYLRFSSELLAPCWTRNMVQKRPSFSLQHQSVTECRSYKKCAHNWSMDNKTCTHASSCVTHRFTCGFSRAAPKFLHLTSTPAATSQVDGPRLLCKTIAFARQLFASLHNNRHSRGMHAIIQSATWMLREAEEQA